MTGTTITRPVEAPADTRLIKHILFPTDFSEAAENAFEYALHMAEALGARITLLHAYYETPVIRGMLPESFVEALRQEKVEEALEHFQKYKAAVQMRNNNIVPVNEILCKGLAADEIEKYVSRNKVDLVIMGTMGAASQSEKILGSVTTRVINAVSCPVLAVPVDVRYQPINHLVFATNFEAEDFELIDKLMLFKESFDAKLSCLHVQDKKDQWTKLNLAFFEKIYAQEMEPRGLNLYTTQSQDIVAGVQSFIHAHKVDMLVMLAHQRDSLNELFRESLTRHMTLHTAVPLLAFHF
ncbi:MAG: universal stress protein [Bacteroidota bacterium]